MKNGGGHDLSHIGFEGKTAARRMRLRARGACLAAPATAAPVAEDRVDDFVNWVLDCAGLEAAAYRTQALHRRLPACLRALKVRSTRAARERVEREPALVSTVVSSLLIGVTEFFREPDIFDWLRTHVLPTLAGRKPPLRIWSAGCSTGAELYSMAILLAKAGLLERSFLLGTDCRGDAIEHAQRGVYEPAALKSVDDAARREYFESAGRGWRPIEILRKPAHWKAANLLAGVEHGPWDIILWRNAAIYLKPERAESIWRRLASVLAADGVLISGKAERPPHDAGLMHAGRCAYRMAMHAASGGRRRTHFGAGRRQT